MASTSRINLYLRTHLLEHFRSPPPSVDNNDLLHDQNWFTQHGGEGERQIQAGELREVFQHNVTGRGCSNCASSGSNF